MKKGGNMENKVIAKEYVINIIKDELKEIKRMRDTALTSESYNIFNGECVVLERILKVLEEK